MRIIAAYNKAVRLRHIGHLDIVRAMGRALRRSGLPVAYSQGFNPHILITFASALSTGFAGTAEVMDVTLTEDVAVEEFLAAMNRALPEDMQLSQAKIVTDVKMPALMALMAAADYEIRLTDASQAAVLAEKLDAFMQREHISAIRKTKSGEKECDIRPLIHAIRIEGDTVFACLSQREGDSCKPDMLMKALFDFAGMESGRTMVTRHTLYGEKNGALTPIMEL